MGQEAVGPSPDEQAAPLAKLRASIQGVYGARDIPGIHPSERSELRLSLVRRVVDHARNAISSPIAEEPPSREDVIGLIQREDAFFALSFERELSIVMERIKEQERKEQEGS